MIREKVCVFVRLFFFFFFLSYSCDVLGAYNELNKVRLAEESNMLWQQKRGLFLVTLSGEESSSSSCSSCPRLLLPGGLLGKGVMCVAVLGLIPSSVAGAGRELGLTRSLCHQPQLVPNCAALAAGVAPALPGRLPREAGDTQWDRRSQDMARHSTWPAALCGVPAWGSW